VSVYRDKQSIEMKKREKEAVKRDICFVSIPKLEAYKYSLKKYHLLRLTYYILEL
jgi:hypothetical protein